MKKKILIISLLFFGTIAILTQLRPNEANAWIAEGYSMEEYMDCDRCEPEVASTCNVSDQCCDSWPECNDGLEPTN